MFARRCSATTREDFAAAYEFARDRGDAAAVQRGLRHARRAGGVLRARRSPRCIPTHGSASGRDDSMRSSTRNRERLRPVGRELPGELRAPASARGGGMRTHPRCAHRGRRSLRPRDQRRPRSGLLEHRGVWRPRSPRASGSPTTSRTSAACISRRRCTRTRSGAPSARRRIYAPRTGSAHRAHPAVPSTSGSTTLGVAAERSDALDLATVLKANQAIAGEIVLERLLGDA